jgi:hypothetical protein
MLFRNFSKQSWWYTSESHWANVHVSAFSSSVAESQVWPQMSHIPVTLCMPSTPIASTMVVCTAATSQKGDDRSKTS